MHFIFCYIEIYKNILAGFISYNTDFCLIIESPTAYVLTSCIRIRQEKLWVSISKCKLRFHKFFQDHWRVKQIPVSFVSLDVEQFLSERFS